MTKEELAKEIETLADQAQQSGFTDEARVLRLLMGATLIGLCKGMIEFLQPFSESVHRVWKTLVDGDSEQDDVLASEFIVEKENA